MKLLTKIDKPWGFEKIWAFSDRVDGYVGKIIHINEGHRLSLQKHEKKEETILVLDGELEVVLSNGVLFLSANDTFHIIPGTIHRFCAHNGACTLIEVSTKELEDVIRIEDDYGR
tara:strand:+ start:1050 stop:1394 length:345 start_codon:yes stop_codon:yes gene_type:complete